MKIICNQKLLANKIGISQKAINGKTTLELLKGILLSAKDGQLKLTGYDLEIGIETYTHYQQHLLLILLSLLLIILLKKQQGGYPHWR